MTAFLPYGRQHIDEDDIAAVADALRSDFLTSGPHVESLEKALCEILDVPFAVACSNGTAALHLSTLALGLKAGDLCIVSAVTFLATANCVRYVGADVLFCDVDPQTGLMRPEDLERALQKADRPIAAVLPVHLTGQAVQIDALREVLNRHPMGKSAYIVEDACHALGTVSSGSDGSKSMVGSARHSELVNFSFHPVKTIAAGEGGAVTTRDAKLAERLRLLRSHGMVRSADQMLFTQQAFDQGVLNPWYYEMHELGFNYRITDFQCALGESQLKKLPRFAERRKQLERLYDEALQSIHPVVRPNEKVVGSDPVLHLYAVRFDFAKIGKSRRQIMELLRERGIGTQVHYLPVNRQPYYQNLYGVVDLPGADTYYSSTLSLPLYPSMVDEDVKHVVDALAEVIAL